MTVNELIKIGEQAYNEFVGSDGERWLISRISKEYNINDSQIYLAVKIYRGIGKPPKIKEDIFNAVKYKNVRMNNMDLILGSVVKVQTGQDLNQLIKKYNIDDMLTLLNFYITNKLFIDAEKEQKAKDVYQVLLKIKNESNVTISFCGEIISMEPTKNRNKYLTGREAHKIGEETHQEYLRLGEANYTSAIDSIVNKYQGKYSENQVIRALSSYLNSKPTSLRNLGNIKKKDKYPNYVYLDYIIHKILSAKNDSDLISIMKKYEWNIIEKTIQEYLTANNDKINECRQLMKQYNNMLQIRAKQAVSKNNPSEDEIINIIKDYLDSQEIYPDIFVAKYNDRCDDLAEFFNRHINSMIDKYKSSTNLAPDVQEELEYINLYLTEKSKRISSFIALVEKIVANSSIRTITALDIQLITGLSLNIFRNSILKKEITDIYGKLTCNKLYNLVTYHITITTLSIDEALKIKYSYNGKTMMEKDIEEILSFLRGNDLPFTFSNITQAFEKLVKKEDYKYQLKMQLKLGTEVKELVASGKPLDKDYLAFKYDIESSYIDEIVQLYNAGILSDELLEVMKAVIESNRIGLRRLNDEYGYQKINDIINRYLSSISFNILNEEDTRKLKNNLELLAQMGLISSAGFTPSI